MLQKRMSARGQQKSLWLALMAALSSPMLVSAEDAKTLDIDNVPVTGNPLGVASDDMVVPVSVLGGRELSLRRQGTLGETLNGIPGVTATQFGPNASRPIIRGLDGERVRIMQNGVGILDASSLSFDHAVGVDPLIIEQIDVVRGPAALLYGGSAMGGVVNAIDHRIPKESLNGYTGRAETRFGGPDNTRNGAAVVDVGNGLFALHADIYSRETSNLEIPGYALSKRKSLADGTARDSRGKDKLNNSSALANGGALGASWTFDTGYLGISYADSNNHYGTVAEEGVRINMENKRTELAGEVRELKGPVQKIKVRMAYTNYEHVEVENGDPSTTFKNRGLQGSLEATHVPLAGLNGVVGYQFQNTRFQALGEEAFVPSVTTVDQGAYVYEEYAIDKHKVTFGGRFGETSIDSHVDDKFTQAFSKHFNPNSFALGGLYTIDESWSVTTNLSHNERAPSYFELYANGPHIATGQVEVGNTNLSKERSNGIDAQLKWKSGGHSVTLGAYATKFKNFIGLFNTGIEVPVDGELLPEAQFRAVPALFKGLELEGKFALNDEWTLKMRGDYVHAKDTRNNQYLPRISPLRLGGGLDYRLGNWNARLDVLHAFKQNNVAENELKTDAYTNVSALVAYKLPVKYNVELFAKANNLLNEEIREHASFLKDIAPSGARAVLVGARADF
ncbi:TonB-dependent receptor [Methylophilus sp. 13]|uniref:TonB-dependent receptor n=1 Tax=Methylophilus sp. 13 TaxID=2781018 RepID=UPI00188FD315|nr:TonB-dependent receptor [Methylophilus sp. 13]MBF5040691.1 TonB-dependent receptor [Methylophilus sp. 13]